MKESEGRMGKWSLLPMNNGLLLSYLQRYVSSNSGTCTTVIDIELGDRFTSVSFKWLFMLRLNRGGRGEL